MYFIYALCEPTGEIRYIGKTQIGLKKRLGQHLQPSNLVTKTWKNNWIKSLLVKGHEPLLKVIEQHESASTLDEAEIKQIEYYQNKGCNLTNNTKGGRGSAGRKFSKETIEKMKASAARKGYTPSMVKSLQLARLKVLGSKMPAHKKLELSRIKGGRPFKDQFGNIYQTIRGAAVQLGMGHAGIGLCLHGLRKQNNGYVFTYLEPLDLDKCP